MYFFHIKFAFMESISDETLETNEVLTIFYLILFLNLFLHFESDNVEFHNLSLKN